MRKTLPLARFVLALPILTFTGCAALDQIQQATAPVMVTDTLAQICQTTENNPIRANDTYVGKRLVTTAKIQMIRENFRPRYTVFLDAGSVPIYADTDNKASVASLIVGKTIRVSGVITSVSDGIGRCSISLKDATF